MRCRILAGLVAVALSAAPLQAAAPKEPLADRVKNAIKAGELYLRTQVTQGHWDVDAGYPRELGGPGGETGLALLALLNCGVRVDDPAIKKGLDYLRSIDLDKAKTYSLSLQAMVLIQAGQPDDKQRIQMIVDKLLDACGPHGWSYTKGQVFQEKGYADNSNTQYALLALHEALQAGYSVDKSVLDKLQKFYKNSQLPDGAWSYAPDTSSPDYRAARFTMTTAGLCGLYIAGMDLSNSKQRLLPDGSAENCGVYDENPNMARALRWLGNSMPDRIEATNVRRYFRGSPFYALYGLERAGRLSGERYLGEHDWYRIGCEFLVANQNKDGSWKGEVGENAVPGEPWPVIATSFSLLFLSKGRTPVLLTKLAYGEPQYAGWNNKRNDIRNLTEFASRELFKRQPLAWQVFDVRTKTADSVAARRELAAELLQSPIVYFNGHDQVPHDDKTIEILKEYIENGGFLFAEACCGREAFDRDFRALMKRMFPDSELTLLPKNHPIWSAAGSKFLVNPSRFPLYGIQQGCKTIVMYSTKPISGYWEANQFNQGDGEMAFNLGADIIAYATGLETPKPKLTAMTIARGPGEKADVKRGYVKVAQLKLNGDWRSAPKAISNLLEDARKAGLDVMLKTDEIWPTQEEDVLSHRLFYMHGRAEFTPDSTADLKHLRFQLESGGGLLLADACCGSPKFDESFHKFIDELFDHKAKLEEIPKDDELFSSRLNGDKLSDKNIRCRRESGKEYANVAPELQGIKYDGRWIVIYSKYDLGCALEKHNSPGCLGYDYESALRIGRAALLYHLNR